MMLFNNRFNPGIALLILCILLSACGPSETESLSGPKVLVFVRDGSYQSHIHEVEIMLSMLEEAGILAVVATQSEDSYQGSDPSLKSDILLQDVNVADYDGFLLPCTAFGGPGDGGVGNIDDVAIPMVAEAVAQKKPIAAQHHSVHTLAEAGLLDGMHYAYGFNVFRNSKFSDGIFDGTGVVQDGNIITSGTCTADGTPDLTQKLIEAVTS
jgi:putative intracellular protease/amidase